VSEAPADDFPVSFVASEQLSLWQSSAHARAGKPIPGRKGHHDRKSRLNGTSSGGVLITAELKASLLAIGLSSHHCPRRAQASWAPRGTEQSLVDIHGLWGHHRMRSVSL